jgi:hypothetical protein
MRRARRHAVDAGQQLGLAGNPAAAVMAHPSQASAERHLTPSAGGVCLVQHAYLAAAVAGDVQEPRREARNGWSRASAGLGSGSVP